MEYNNPEEFDALYQDRTLHLGMGDYCDWDHLELLLGVSNTHVELALWNTSISAFVSEHRFERGKAVDAAVIAKILGHNIRALVHYLAPVVESILDAGAGALAEPEPVVAFEAVRNPGLWSPSEEVGF